MDKEAQQPQESNFLKILFCILPALMEPREERADLPGARGPHGSQGGLWSAQELRSSASLN
jgi:hypothetical protein